MTNKNYAELTLYFGLVPQDGIGERTFESSDINSKSLFIKEAYQSAMKNVLRYLDSKLLTIGWDPFVKNEKEASYFIDFAEKNIPNSKGLIKLEDAQHGKIRFHRQIIFNGWGRDNESDLIDELKKSGYEPENKEMKQLVDIEKHFMTKREFEKKKLKLINKPWERHIKFY
ncbi:hypothetical protein M0R19_00920 [Candidatus Pacearchaeota archaeon]|jgi:hypothetical protein|nr:hypothetical protein [Candidatus Pacearchaeota archaeon]